MPIAVVRPNGDDHHLRPNRSQKRIAAGRIRSVVAGLQHDGRRELPAGQQRRLGRLARVAGQQDG
jgi:hypothetical protein